MRHIQIAHLPVQYGRFSSFFRPARQTLPDAVIFRRITPSLRRFNRCAPSPNRRGDDHRRSCVAQIYLAFLPRCGIIARYDSSCSESSARSTPRAVPRRCFARARQVGKTTLALSLTNEAENSPLYLDLELPSDRAKLADPELYLSDYEDRLVILDEIHRLPGIFQTLRSLIDRRKRKGKRTGQFLLLGSASIDLLQQSAETLAGRIAYMELTPFLESEVVGSSPNAAQALWVRGGFPDSFLAETEVQSFEWRAAFIQTYLERDVPSLGPRVPAETLHRFWQMLGHNQGQMLNAAQLAAGLGISGQTVGRYLDIMVDLLLVRRLQPWASNVGKRLVRSPKVYVRDSGLLHTLLGIRDQETYWASGGRIELGGNAHREHLERGTGQYPGVVLPHLSRGRD